MDSTLPVFFGPPPQKATDRSVEDISEFNAGVNQIMGFTLV
jgi:hypothetical protein